MSPDCAQLRRFENKRRFDQVCVNAQVSSTLIRGHLCACRRRKRELRAGYFKLDNARKPPRAVAFLRRVPTFPRSVFGSWFYGDAPRVFDSESVSTCVRRKMAWWCDEDRASRVYSYRRSNECALTSLSDDRSFDRNCAFPSLPSSSWIRISIANEDKKYDVSNKKNYSMTVTVSFLIYTFCSSNHASTGGKVDCVYRVRTARARLELSVLSSFLKSQAEASRERKRERSRSAPSRWYLASSRSARSIRSSTR